jgi:hypothetical protein
VGQPALSLEGADPAWDPEGPPGFGAWHVLAAAAFHSWIPLACKDAAQTQTQTRPPPNCIQQSEIETTHPTSLHCIGTLPPSVAALLRDTNSLVISPASQRSQRSQSSESKRRPAPSLPRRLLAYLISKFPELTHRSVPPTNPSTRWIMKIAQNYNHAILATPRQCGQRERHAPPFAT